MRVRKKPDLRIQIPSYPHDYVEMPPEIRRLTAEIQSANVVSPSTSQAPGVNAPVIVIQTTNDDINLATNGNDNSIKVNKNFEAGSTENNINDAKEIKAMSSDSSINLEPPRTPEVKFIGSEDLQPTRFTQENGNDSQQSNPNTHEENNEMEKDPIVYRNKLRRGSVSVLHGLRYHEADKQTTINVSLITCTNFHITIEKTITNVDKHLIIVKKNGSYS